MNMPQKGTPNSSLKRRAATPAQLAGAALHIYHRPRRPSARLSGPASLERQAAQIREAFPHFSHSHE